MAISNHNPVMDFSIEPFSPFQPAVKLHFIFRGNDVIADEAADFIFQFRHADFPVNGGKLPVTL